MPQSLSNVVVHAAFSTSDRRPSLRDEFRGELFDYLGGALKGGGAAPLCVGGVADHVHLLFRLPRTETLANVIGGVKAASSKWIKGKGPGLGDFAWQAGYAAFSVGRSEVEVVRAYVRNQAEHHARLSFQDEMRTLFEDYGIKFNERYVWD